MFAWRAFPARGDASPGAYLTVPALSGAGIRVAFTARAGGVAGPLDLSLVGGADPGVVVRNRARALGAVGASPEAWTSGRQIHGTRVARVGSDECGSGAFDPGTALADVDALWTDEPGPALVILTADCLPVLIVDPTRPAVGVVHAGWRGLVAGVVGRTVAAMGGPENLRAFVGPSIGPCCYEVGPEVAEEARASLGSEVVRGSTNGVRLDLWRGARAALAAAGVGAVLTSALCTRCEPHRFFSHRAAATGRQGVLAMIGSE